MTSPPCRKICAANWRNSDCCDRDRKKSCDCPIPLVQFSHMQCAFVISGALEAVKITEGSRPAAEAEICRCVQPYVDESWFAAAYAAKRAHREREAWRPDLESSLLVGRFPCSPAALLLRAGDEAVLPEASILSRMAAQNRDYSHSLP